MKTNNIRIWYKKENRWLDYWSEEDPMLHLKWNTIYLYDREIQDWSSEIKKEDFIINNSLDIFDIDGKEIYEGDILSFNPSIEGTQSCLWKNFGHLWRFSKIDGITISFNHIYSEMSMKFNDFLLEYDVNYKIIGNEYEN